MKQNPLQQANIQQNQEAQQNMQSNQRANLFGAAGKITGRFMDRVKNTANRCKRWSRRTSTGHYRTTRQVRRFNEW